MATIWIGNDYLIKNSIIDSNVEFSKIEPTIKLVQDKYLLPVLGTNLYNAINTAIEAYIDSSTAIPAKYTLLLDEWIKPLLVQFIMCEASPTFKYRYANKGIMVKSSDNSQPISVSELEFAMDGWKKNGEMYATRLINYLQYNPTNYPELLNNTAGNIFPRFEGYDIDIYLGSSNPRELANGAIDVKRYYE